MCHHLNNNIYFYVGRSPTSKAQDKSPIGFGLAPAAQLKTGSVMDILGKSSSSPSSSSAGGFGIAVASELKTGSVMDILGKGKDVTC